MNDTGRYKIAVIGAGVSGIVAAHLLQRKHDVTLYEKNKYVGGHTNTIIIPDGPDAGTPVDTGFIVLNRATYPNFIKFLETLDVPIAMTDMSFSYYCQTTGLFYATRNMNAIFAQRRNIIRPKYIHFLTEIIRFIRKTKEDYDNKRLEDITLGRFLKQFNFSDAVIQQFVIPMAAAIWSSPDTAMMEFPMKTFARFYSNHGLLALGNHPSWHFIPGGSHTYVKSFLARFNGHAITNQPVKNIKRENKEVVLTLADGRKVTYDRVIIATHADEALAMLYDPSPEETALLSPWKYSKNDTWLHTDRSFMPPSKRAWASWNYTRKRKGATDSPITVTYYMNRLQQLKTKRDYFVTLNPDEEIPESKVIRRISYTHPVFDPGAFDTQKDLAGLNGQRQTCFCGSYFGYGFHEDGVKSGMQAAKALGIEP